MGSTDYYWTAYKMFYSPPGTPEELRCIGCRYTISGASFALMAASMYGAKRTGKTNAYVGGIFAMGAFIFLSTGSIALKAAIEDKKWNEMKLKEWAAELKKQRREISGKEVAPNA